MAEINKDPLDRGLEDINALLKSVGIDPIDSLNEDSDKEEKRTEPEGGEERTKHFSLLKKGVTENSGDTKHFKLGGSKTEKAKDAEAEAEKENDGQIFFEGYLDDENKPENVSDEQIEESLRKTRKKLIDNFRVLSNQDDDKAIFEKPPTGEGGKSMVDSLEPMKGETLFDAVERQGESKAGKGFLRFGEKAVKTLQQKTKREKKQEEIKKAQTQRKSLKERKEHCKKRIIIFSVLLGASLLLFLLSGLYIKTGVLSFAFSGGGWIYVLLNLALIGAGVGLGLDYVKEGFAGIKSLQFNLSSCSLIVTAVAVLQCLMLLIFKPTAASGFSVYSSSSLFAFLALYVSEYYRLTGVRRDISVMMRSDSHTTLQLIDNKADASALGYGISGKSEPKILYTTKADLSGSFESFSQGKNGEGKLFTAMLCASLVLSVGIGIFSAVKGGSAAGFFTCFASTAAVCSPMLLSLLGVFVKASSDSATAGDCAVVASADSAEQVAKCDAIVADIGEIFEADVSKFRTVAGSKMSTSDAAVFACSALKSGKSIICKAFDDFIKTQNIKLPVCEDIRYEDRMGYSGWVINRRVLVGNRQMLIEHSIEAPSEEEENAFSGGKNVLYLAVEGVIVAYFLVGYRVRSDIKKHIRAFNRSGIILMLSGGDPCLNEELASKKLMADVAAIRLVNLKSTQLVDEYRQNPTLRKAGGLVCSSKDSNSFSLIGKALKLFEADKLAKITLFTGLAFCFCLQVLSVILKVSAAFNPITVIIFQLIWVAISYYIGLRASK